MKWWSIERVLMAAAAEGTGAAGGGAAAAGGATAGGGGGAAGAAEGGAAAAAAGGAAGSVLAAEGAEGAAGGGAAGGAAGSVLAAEGAAGAAEGGAAAGGAAEGGAAAEVKAEEVAAYLGKIRKVELGDGSGDAPAWDDGALKVVVPVLIRHKVSEDAANELVAAYAQHVSAQHRQAAEAERAVLAGLRQECQARFGADLKRFAAEGRRGGEHVFGRELFQRLARVEAFGSDPDIITALARIGRGLTPDNAAGQHQGATAERTLAERMYG